MKVQATTAICFLALFQTCVCSCWQVLWCMAWIDIQWLQKVCNCSLHAFRYLASSYCEQRNMWQCTLCISHTELLVDNLSICVTTMAGHHFTTPAMQGTRRLQTCYWKQVLTHMQGISVIHSFNLYFCEYQIFTRFCKPRTEKVKIFQQSILILHAK